MSDKTRIDKAVEVALQYGRIDGDHHKTWVIDQMLRRLLGKDYNKIVNSPEDVKEYGKWDKGIAP